MTFKIPDLGATSDIPEALPVTGPTSPNGDRDTALDHDPAVIVPPPLAPAGKSASEEQAEADLDASLETANTCATCGHPIQEHTRHDHACADVGCSCSAFASDAPRLGPVARADDEEPLR